MYFIIYRTINNINNKYYIGCHKTKKLDDGYIGSGKLLQLAIKKYGKENFTREILYLCKDSKEMFEKEREIVNEEVVKDKNSYNVKIGGEANYYFINHNHLNHKNNQHLIHGEKCKNDIEYRKQFIQKMTIINKKNGLKLKGKTPSNKNMKIIYNPETHLTKYVSKNDIETYLNNGWIKGRTGKETRQRIYVYNDLLKQCKYISLHKLSEYLSSGWFEGKKNF